MYIALIIIMIWPILGSVFYELSFYEKNEWSRSVNYYYGFSDYEYPGREKTIFGRILYMIFGPFAALDYITELLANRSFKCYQSYKKIKGKQMDKIDTSIKIVHRSFIAIFFLFWLGLIGLVVSAIF